jgi:hypothetical protein
MNPHRGTYWINAVSLGRSMFGGYIWNLQANRVEYMMHCTQTWGLSQPLGRTPNREVGSRWMNL